MIKNMMMNIVIFMYLFYSHSIHFLSKKAAEYRKEAYFFAYQTSRNVASPVRYFIAPYFKINVPTAEHLETFARIKQLKQEMNNVRHHVGPLSAEQSFQLIEEVTAKSCQITALQAPISAVTMRYAYQHDQLTFVEKIFTDRQEELDKHLRIVTQECQLLSQ